MFSGLAHFPRFDTVIFAKRLVQSATNQQVRVRFAPSPTSKLQLGSLRIALFNYLFARKHQGAFILRIEDTDRRKNVPGAIDSFEAILDRYGLYRDEGPKEGGPVGPYQQSRRIQHYREHAEQLTETGHAYRCFCTSQRLEILRKNAQRNNEPPKYDNKCRSLSAEEAKSRVANGEPFVYRYKYDVKNVQFTDTVYGEIAQETDEGDFVLMKSDGYPTYHFANVVDDHLMRVSHVIRGWEWIASTPKHVQLYQSFGWSPPAWVHLPLITRDGSKKLSKRDADAFVEYYDETNGYLPIAVLNFLLRNGSGLANFDPNRLYSLEEMVENFDESKIGRRNFMVDQKYMESYGRLAFQQCSEDDTLIPEIQRRLRLDTPEIDEDLLSPAYIRKVLALLKKNHMDFCKLSELTSLTGTFHFLFSRPKSPKKLLKKFSRQKAKLLLDDLVSDASLYSVKGCERLADRHQIEYPQVVLNLARLSLTNDISATPISEIFMFFSTDECRSRFKNMRDLLTISS